jgi:hypothetical protein
LTVRLAHKLAATGFQSSFDLADICTLTL